VLTIRAEKKFERKDEKENYQFMERSYGTFHRALHLPYSVDPEQVRANFENGVLTVTLLKTASQERSRRIQIQGGRPECPASWRNQRRFDGRSRSPDPDGTQRCPGRAGVRGWTGRRDRERAPLGPPRSDQRSPVDDVPVPAAVMLLRPLPARQAQRGKPEPEGHMHGGGQAASAGQQEGRSRDPEAERHIIGRLINAVAARAARSGRPVRTTTRYRGL